MQVALDGRDTAPLVPQVAALADKDKEALGFLPRSAFLDAALQGRLLVAVTEAANPQVAGFLLYGGVFPRARIYQIGVLQSFRRQGVAALLMKSLVSRLEAQSYLSLSARVADDLPDAARFYSASGFVPVRRVQGGAARDRRLTIFVLSLATADLFSLQDTSATNDNLLALALRSSQVGDAPFYVIDLNVLFDLIRDRKRSASARKLFGAALAHKVRLVVSPEFLVELRRTTFSDTEDGILQMALQLPQLVAPKAEDLKDLAALAHRIVFEDTRSPYAGSPQSWSDAHHVAHAALSKASGYVTSDGAILASQRRLREEVGIDVASLEELVELVEDQEVPKQPPHTRGSGFELDDISLSLCKEYFAASDALRNVSPLVEGTKTALPVRRVAVRQGNLIAAMCIYLPPATPTSPGGMILHPNPRSLGSSFFLDALFDRVIGDATNHGPISVELTAIDDESLGAVSAFARSRGFVRSNTHAPFTKVALGRPLTPLNWKALAVALRRKTAIDLAEFSVDQQPRVRIALGPHGDLQLPSARFEELISPAIVAWPGRSAIIQPIGRAYADELLGTARQRSLLDSRDAAFLSRRSYVGSPRAARFMTPGSIMFFYESRRTRGRGAIVAVARIVDALSVSKHSVSRRQLREVVVDDVSKFTRADDVLITSFDNVLALPNPVMLEDLRKIDAVGSKNLQTATPISSEIASTILDLGWAE